MTGSKRLGLVLLLLVAIAMAQVHALRIVKKPIIVNTGKARFVIDVDGAAAAALEGSSLESSSSSSSESGSMSFSSESGSSSSSSSSESASLESSSFSSSSSESSESSMSMSESSASSPSPPKSSSSDLGLPPEPEAAKAYTPRPKCNEDHCDLLDEFSAESSSSSSFSSSPSSSSLSFSIQDSESSSVGCTTNCAADTSASRPLFGPTTLSQTLGDFNNGMVSVPQTQTIAQPSRGGTITLSGSGSSSGAIPATRTIPERSSCGCNTCPCPAQNQDGLIDAAPLVESCGCNTCPCPAVDASPLQDGCNEGGCLSEAEQRAREMEAERAKLMEEKEKRRTSLHGELKKHQDNMAHIEGLMRALSFQYSELRRSHESLRRHIGANKAALRQVAGVSDTADLDIEDKSPNFTDSLDNIPELNASKDGEKITQEMSATQELESNILKQSHARAKVLVDQFVERQKKQAADVLGKR